jgi:hypothetical protein
LNKTLAVLRQNQNIHMARNALTVTPRGISILAAGAILPTSKEMDLPRGPPRYLVFGMAISVDTVAKIGGRYTIDNLRIVPLAGEQSGTKLLRYPWGEAVAAVTWQARLPGDLASKAYGRNARASSLRCSPHGARFAHLMFCIAENVRSEFSLLRDNILKPVQDWP